MKENFTRCMDFVLRCETGDDLKGAYSHDPADPGGETKWGISKRAHSDVDIKNLTRLEATAIYHEEYWLPSGCDSHPWPWDLIMFDTAVNLGGKRAGILYQENPDWKDYLMARINYYLSITHKTHDKYIKGWVKRVMDLNREITRR